MEQQAMTTQTRPTMPLTVECRQVSGSEKHASGRTRSIRDAQNQTPAPRNDRTGAYLKTARTLCSRSYATRTGTGCWRNFSRTREINV